jgi:TolA-binding protein
MRFRAVLPFAALAALTLSPAAAQRRPPSPDQRIDRLEKQVRQVQKQVFPKGQPADTAGFSDDPAATQDAVNNLNNRLDAVEKQLADIVRQAEENGNRVGQMETELTRLRADQDRRLRTLETNSAAAEPGSGAVEQPVQSEQADSPPPRPKPKVESKAVKPEPAAIVSTGNADADVELAYDQGYQLWTSGNYDAAITSLRAMAKKYPDSRRVSWANNLIGRSLLDKGQPRAAAETLLANYRKDPKGERAQDSLFYLGQALMKLGQPAQACKAYSELEDVYSGQVRAPLKAALPGAKAEAKCS